MIDYTVVRVPRWVNGGENDVTIVSAVNNMTKEGWTPVGGVAVDNEVFYQALIKVGDVPSNNSNQ